MVIKVANRRIVNLIGPTLVDTLKLRLEVLRVMVSQRDDPYQINAAPYDDDGAVIASAAGIFISGETDEVDRFLSDLGKRGIDFAISEVAL